MSMELACNYSLPLMHLLEAGVVYVDWIKLSRRNFLDEEMAAAAGSRTLLLHTLHHLGARSLLDGAPDWRGTVERLVRARSPHVAAHLAFLGETLDLATPRILTLEYGGTGPEFETPERNSLAALERQLLRLARVARGAQLAGRADAFHRSRTRRS